MQELTLAKTAAWLQQCEDAYILIHRSPDGDCIGAGYALAEILQQLGKRAAVLCNDEIPPRYQFMLPEQLAAADFPPKCIIAVDVADTKLLGSRIQEQYGSLADIIRKATTYPTCPTPRQDCWTVRLRRCVKSSTACAACCRFR